MIHNAQSEDDASDPTRRAELHRQAIRDANLLRMTGAIVMAGAIGFAVAFPSSTTTPHDPTGAPELQAR